MKAVQFNEYGGPEVLRVLDVAEPRPGPGQIRITVRAAGVNPSDWKRRAGLYQGFEAVTFPAGVGVEASGVVDETGPGVLDVSAGDAVFGFGESTVAQHALLTRWVRKPESLPFEVAGSLPVVAETAWRGLEELGMRSGETLLVSGAAGGIGTAAVQLARHRGIRVIGTASPEKHRYLRGLGVLPVPHGPGLAERVKALAPQGVDAALHLAGAGILPELIAITGEASRVLSVADFSAPELGARFSYGPPRNPEAVLAEVARRCVEGRFLMPLERTFRLEDTAQAHALSAAGHVAGKLAIVVA